MPGGWWNVQYDHGNLHGKLGKGESMVHGYRKAGNSEYTEGLTAAGSEQNVDARLHNLSRRAELRYLSRRAELRYLTVQVGRVAKAELDVYRKVGCAYNA